MDFAEDVELLNERNSGRSGDKPPGQGDNNYRHENGAIVVINEKTKNESENESEENTGHNSPKHKASRPFSRKLITALHSSPEP